MVIRFTDPFEALLNLQRNLERSMSSDWFGSNTSSRGSYPPINVFRRDDDYVVIAELPMWWGDAQPLMPESPESPAITRRGTLVAMVPNPESRPTR